MRRGARAGRASGGGAAPAGPGIRLRRDGHLAWLIIDRPQRRNAIDRASRTLLAELAAELEADSEIRVVILMGAGTSFCAGTDLKERPPKEVVHPLAAPAPPITKPIEAFTKPVLAAINGPAAGGGFELALAADLRIASTAATFSLPEVRVGSLPGSGGTQRLFSALPAAVAWKLLLTGEPIDAAEAHRLGLVSDLVSPEELEPRVAEVAGRIAANAPLSIRAAKLAGRAATASGGAAGRALERALWALVATTEDRAEGRAAFREGRPPRYRGR